MTLDEIRTFLVNNVEPLTDKIYGNRYRVAAHLKDGTYLPCVVIQSKQQQVELALRRFDELSSKPSQYKSVVESFVSSGSKLSEYHLRDVELSPFAWPAELMRSIHGETTMGWTAFVVEMKDGTRHSYGTSFNFEFFELPPGYSHSDIVKIRSGVLYSSARGVEAFSIEGLRQTKPYTDKPFFTCYLTALGSGR
ncbi:MAG TPA: hypothetical protein VI216_06105 [Candidatus Acidoferrales bacterium]